MFARSVLVFVKVTGYIGLLVIWKAKASRGSGTVLHGRGNKKRRKNLKKRELNVKRVISVSDR